MSVNLVMQSGIVKNPALRYGADGKPECRFTLQQVENGFTLFLPCCALGGSAEKVAEQITDGDHIVITSGRLTYRKRETKLGEQSRMEILVWSVEILTTLPQDERSPHGEGGDRPRHRTRVLSPRCDAADIHERPSKAVLPRIRIRRRGEAVQ